MLNQVVDSRKTTYIYNDDKIQKNSRYRNELSVNEEFFNLYPNWYIINGEPYYFKEIEDLQRLVNELLCVRLAKIFDLKTAEYSLAIKSTSKKIRTGLITKNVYDKNKKYKNLFDIGEVTASGIMSKECLNDVLNLCSSEVERKKLMLEILKMSIFDFYTHQVDRVYPNINFQTAPDVSLAPLFDYSETFDAEYSYGNTREYVLFQNYTWLEKSKYIYQSDLLKIAFPSEELEDIFNEFPELYQYFIKILDLDLEAHLKTIERENDFDIPSYLYNFYLDYDYKQKKFIKKIR